MESPADHAGTHSGEKPFVCQQCGKCFSDSSTLRKHNRTHSGEKPFECKQCGKCFSDSGNLKQHTRTHSGEKPFECKQCGKCFSQSMHLQRHTQTHSREKPFECQPCGKCFSYSSTLREHTRRIHSGEKPFECQKCGKCFSDSSSLRQHTGTRSCENPFQCQQCGTCFSQSIHLQQHTRRHSGQKPFQCQHCGKCFTKFGFLRRHTQTHSAEKPFECQHCGKCFIQSAHLQKHTWTHSGEKPFECQQCGKSFSHSCGLERHTRFHACEKPFPCQQCGKCFKSEHGRNMHVRVHTGEKPFECQQCGRCFRQSSNLTVHAQTHSGEKSYENQQSGDCVSTSSHLTTHTRTHTNEMCFDQASSLGKPSRPLSHMIAGKHSPESMNNTLKSQERPTMPEKEVDYNDIIEDVKKRISCDHVQGSTYPTAETNQCDLRDEPYRKSPHNMLHEDMSHLHEECKHLNTNEFTQMVQAKIKKEPPTEEYQPESHERHETSKIEVDYSGIVQGIKREWDIKYVQESNYLTNETNKCESRTKPDSKSSADVILHRCSEDISHRRERCKHLNTNDLIQIVQAKIKKEPSPEEHQPESPQRLETSQIEVDYSGIIKEIKREWAMEPVQESIYLTKERNKCESRTKPDSKSPSNFMLHECPEDMSYLREESKHLNTNDSIQKVQAKIKKEPPTREYQSESQERHETSEMDVDYSNIKKEWDINNGQESNCT